jgi:hypothetical protein
MVKIEDITTTEVDKAGQLAEEVFGKSVDVYTRRNITEVYVIKHFMKFFNPKLILAVTPALNEVRLYNEKYFDKAKEFASRYESNFGREVTLKTNYSKRSKK